MSFIKKPVTGMRDILPEETAVRERLKNIIRTTYFAYGFTEIETPVVEHIDNLLSKQGGENEKLIFKILKRGDNLKRAFEKTAATAGQAVSSASAGAAASSSESAAMAGTGPAVLPDLAASADILSEEGLRYDLTLPLSRYYAANSGRLPSPFKALQIGPVFRADRPQKGRFRQFTQCDIDILGDGTNLAEKELILATTEALEKIGFGKYNFYIVINDRRFLYELIKYAGMREEDAGEILITLDKADKIGAGGVDAELKTLGCTAESVAKLRTALDNYGTDAAGVRNFAALIDSDTARDAGENLADIMESVGSVKGRNIRMVFDPTLVRGMGYYTGTIFEIKTEAFSSSVGGGGRYDKMVGRFTGQNVPAVGFSIGFERIMTILMEDPDTKTADTSREAWLIEKGMPADRLGEIFDEAIKRRTEGAQVLTVWMAKNKKFQKEQLKSRGYNVIRDYYKEGLRH